MLPVRALAGILCYATSPFILNRYARDLQAAGIASPEIPKPRDDQHALVVPRSANLIGNETLVLEDLDLQGEGNGPTRQWAEAIAGLIHPADAEARQDFGSRFAILPDNILGFLAETATELRTRISIDEKTGTVKKGALWFEEHLPAEAVLWGVYALSRIAHPEAAPERRRARAGAAQAARRSGRATAAARRSGRGRARPGAAAGHGGAGMSLRAHRVATEAFARVEARKELQDQPRKQYGAIAHKLPGMILQNGLAQATGFLLAKGGNSDEDHHSWLLDDLNAVLQAGDASLSASAPDREQLHQRIIAADLSETLRRTRAALEASGWLKRYVQGLLRISATGDDANETDQQQRD